MRDLVTDLSRSLQSAYLFLGNEDGDSFKCDQHGRMDCKECLPMFPVNESEVRTFD